MHNIKTSKVCRGHKFVKGLNIQILFAVVCMWQLVRPYMLPITDELTFTITVSGDWFCLIASSFAFPIPSIGMMSKLGPMIWLTWTRNKSLEGEGTETNKKKILFIY